ncbi:MAG: ISL3 family transposase, partial [Bacteroidota bacterium]
MVVTDQETRNALHEGKERTKESLIALYQSYGEENRRGIRSISMDMCP